MVQGERCRRVAEFLHFCVFFPATQLTRFFATQNVDCVNRSTDGSKVVELSIYNILFLVVISVSSVKI